MLRPSNKQTSGFSLLELSFVLAIIVILGTMGIFVFYQSSRRLSLDNDSRLVIEILNKARQYATDSKNRMPWGVHFNQNNFVLFPGANFNPNNPANNTLSLSNYSTFSSVSLSDGSNVIFNQLDGSASSYGNVILSAKNNPSEFTMIYIQSSGVISASSTPPSPIPSM